MWLITWLTLRLRQAQYYALNLIGMVAPLSESLTDPDREKNASTVFPKIDLAGDTHLHTMSPKTTIIPISILSLLVVVLFYPIQSQ